MKCSQKDTIQEYEITIEHPKLLLMTIVEIN